tara:strand:- start:944 stop:1954 length:1011 start_codon:yes stop_codon:yes gene_type:complete
MSGTFHITEGEIVSDETMNDSESVQPEVDTADLAALVDVPESTDAAPVEASAPEAAPEEAAPAEAAPAPLRDEPAKSFDPMFETIDDDDLRLDGFYDKITEQDIKDLPTVAKRMLHNFRIAYKQQQKTLEAQQSSFDRKIQDRESAVHSLERDFARRQAEFAAVIDDPRVKDAMSVSDDELPDIMSEAGIEARINKGIAEGLTKAFQPMREASVERKQESRYLDFLETHPEMRDPAFKKTVAGLVRDREQTTSPLSTQDAYEIVKARSIMEQQHKRAQSERRARAESARRVKRSSMSGSPGVEDIPLEIKKQGAASIASWLQANPEAAKRISNTVR